MRRPSVRTTLTGAVIALLATGTAACGGSDSGSRSGDADGAGGEGGGLGARGTEAVQALVAAAETTEEVTSADFEAVTTSPGSDGEELAVSGSLSWADELAMELTMNGEQLPMAGGLSGGRAEDVSVVWLDGVMYMDMGTEFASEFGGRGWMRLDLVDIAEQTGDEGLADAMSQGLDQTSQDPSQQMRLLLESPNVDLVGEDTVNGTPVDHYEGSISVEDALNSGGGSDLLTDQEREEIADAMREQGIDSYDIAVWVDEDDFPVRIRQTYDTADGPVESEVTYSNLGTEVSVAAPPEDDVVDFMDLLGDLQEGLGIGDGTGA